MTDDATKQPGDINPSQQQPAEHRKGETALIDLGAEANLAPRPRTIRIKRITTIKKIRIPGKTPFAPQGHAPLSPSAPAAELTPATPPSIPAAIPAGEPASQAIRLKRPPAIPVNTGPDEAKAESVKADADQKGSTIRLDIPIAANKQQAAEGTVRVELQDLGLAPKEPVTTAPQKAQPAPQAAAEPKTVPPSSPPASVEPVAKEVLASKPVTDQIQAEPQQTLERKTETARIVLGEKSAEPNPAEATTVEAKRSTTPIPPIQKPQTIRLKRPTTLTPGKLPSTESMAQPEQQMPGKGETSKIELPQNLVSPTPLTRRKTIKIKRVVKTPQTVKMGPRTVKVAPSKADVASKLTAASKPTAALRPGVDEPAEQEPDKQEQPKTEEKIGMVFSVVVVAAIVLMVGLVCVMLLQMLGTKIMLPFSS